MPLGDGGTLPKRVSLPFCIIRFVLRARGGAPRAGLPYLEGRETLPGRDKFCLH